MLLPSRLSAKFIVSSARSLIVVVLVAAVAYVYLLNGATDLTHFNCLDAWQELIAIYVFTFIGLIAAPKLRKGDVTTLMITAGLCFVFAQAVAGLPRSVSDVVAAVVGPLAMFFTTWTNQLRAAARDRGREPLRDALDHADRRKRDWMRRSDKAKRVAEIVDSEGKSHASTFYEAS